MLGSSGNTQKFSYGALSLLTLAGLYVLAQHDYLVFHMSVKLLGVIIAVGVFMIAWNSRHYLENGYLALLGVAYLFIAAVDLAHTLAYKGMGLFAGDDANPATQLWIAARYLEAGTLVAAPFFLRRKVRSALALGAYAGIFALIILSVFVWKVFPTCFVDGVGPTMFKTVSEYVISLLLVVAVALLIRRRSGFDRYVLRWLGASLALMIGSGLLFTFYVSGYGISNLFGYVLKLASFCLIYRAIIETGLRRPFSLIFRELKQSREALQETNASLEQRVTERTEELRRANVHLHDALNVRTATENRLRRLNFVLRAIRSVNQLIVRERDRNRILGEVCTALVEGSGYSTAWIALNDPTMGLIASSYRSIREMSPAFSRLLSEGKLPACGRLAWTKGGITSIDASGPLCNECPNGGTSCDRDRIAACLEHEGVRYGVLGVTSSGELVTSEEEVDLLAEVVEDIAFALHGMDVEEERHQAVDALRKALKGTTQAIAATAESRDPYTAGHQRKVTELAVAIGAELGFDQDRLESLQMAGLMHDIGKIGVPSEILSKPSRLTDAEMALIQNHPQMAYDILRNIDFPWPIAEFVLQHHERLDGSGYPNGLSGDQIRLEARIIAVADVVEAVSSHRPYRAALGLDAALDEITEGSGTAYDPAVVGVCARLFREKGFEFDRAT